MAKKLTVAQQWIIARANEAGYFPTATDAKKINRLSAARIVERIDTTEIKLSLSEQAKIVDEVIRGFMQDAADARKKPSK